jgi:membrane protease YdiL (CAAX protease family)/ABC-type Na+ efflux pump permease subunit
LSPAGRALRTAARVALGELRSLARAPGALLLLLLMPLILPPLGLLGSSRLEQAAVEGVADAVLRVRGPAELAGWVGPDDQLAVVAEGALPRDGRLRAEDVVAEVELPDAAARAAGAGPTLRYRRDASLSRAARDRLQAVFARQGAAEQEAAWAAAGAPLAPDAVLVATWEDVNPSAHLAAAAHSLPLVLVAILSIVASYAALDVVTGERERGTLETLLSTRAERRAVLGGKFLVVGGQVLLAALLALLSLPLAVAVGAIDGASLPLPPLRDLLLVAVVCLPLSLVLSGAAMAIAAYAPTYRAGSMLTSPLLLGAVGLAGLASSDAVELGPLMSLLPVADAALLIRDIVSGRPEPGDLVAVLVASGVHAALALGLARRLLEREDLVAGGLSSTARRLADRMLPEALGLFLFVALLNWFFGQLVQARAGLPGVALSLGLLIGLPGVAALWVLGLPLRAGLGLSRPRGRDLLLGLVAGLCAPGLGMGVHALQAPLVPPSSEWARAFSATLFDGVGLPALLLVMSLCPAVFEELLFRGAMVRLVRGALRPVGVALFVGLSFGALHMDLERLLPTAALGVLMTAARLRSGVIWVPMLVHFLNNALLVTGGHQGWAFTTAPPDWLLGLGAAACIGAVALMGRGRD